VVEGIRRRLGRVRERIEAAAARSGRPASAVTLVAVSKTMPAEAVWEAVGAGVQVLGENRVQEAREKIALVPGVAEWHMIGHLQTNKAKLAVALFSRIHSLDSIRLARELDRHAEEAGKNLRCLVEVNLGGESQKSGEAEEELRALLAEASRFSHLAIDGLMIVPPFLPDPEAVRPFFRRLRLLRDQLVREGFPLTELSMGMSNDFEAAIEEGATLVRIGTALFGTRG
jgi:pyridoxal phosphate enzyme (YggS family)